MHQILVYADSLSWGIIPNTRKRLPFNKRWPGVLEQELNLTHRSARIIEDCLNGRRTAWDDPHKSGRNGVVGLQQRIEINSPLSLVILFLGTNDFQSMHQHDAKQSAEGVRSLIQEIRKAPIEPGMTIPPILVVAPPPIQMAKGAIAPKFKDAEHKALGLAAAIESVAQETDCAFFNSGSVTNTSKIDGVHLDEDQHLVLGKALAEKIAPILESYQTE